LGILWAAAFNPFASRLMGQYEARTSAAVNAGEIKGQDVWLREATPDLQRIWHAESLNLGKRTLVRPMVI